MTLDELIAQLTRAREFHGGDHPVIVTGAYASSADDLELVYYPSGGFYQPGAHLAIATSICSG